MNAMNQRGRSKALEPRRPLRSDFTKQVLRQAATAHRRNATKKQFQTIFKEPFSMKSIKFLRTVPGAALAAAVVVATGSVGVYALSNWFGGDVSVQQDTSVFSVDVSSCKGNVPVGVNPTDDPHAIKFKIMGNPHISAQALQQDLLGECEHNAVTEFYAAKFPQAGLPASDGSYASTTNSVKYALLPATIARIAGDSITLKSTGSKAASFGTRTFTFAADMSVYDEGHAGSVNDLKPGDNVMFVAYAANAAGAPTEGASILDRSDVRVLSIFKTRYNDGTGSSFDYQSNNVLPLDTYNQLPNGKQYK